MPNGGMLYGEDATSPPDIVDQLLVVVSSAIDRALAVGTNLNRIVIE